MAALHNPTSLARWQHDDLCPPSEEEGRESESSRGRVGVWENEWEREKERKKERTNESKKKDTKQKWMDKTEMGWKVENRYEEERGETDAFDKTPVKPRVLSLSHSLSPFFQRHLGRLKSGSFKLSFYHKTIFLFSYSFPFNLGEGGGCTVFSSNLDFTSNGDPTLYQNCLPDNNYLKTSLNLWHQQKIILGSHSTS